MAKTDGLIMWIDSPAPHELDQRAQRIYAELADDQGRVDGIMRAHALRPHTLEGHLKLYRSVLGHPRNKLPHWFMETIGVLVSRLNGCKYCVAHHRKGLLKSLDDKSRLDKILKWLDKPDDIPPKVFSDKERLALIYAGNLTVAPTQIHEDQLAELRGAGWTDGEILEINQVAAYFAYANRTVMGLGVQIEAWHDEDD
ncbi:peroxidase-related enzyme [Gammaproteobacteria bacterium AB-CW1]|uniref:Peroxidase-related enzyme n=1 Tax=Natronospira elongata TaxID=3110268 RepID=A0AAP6MMU6_9GAMM|nr:peroxidase-related enzyme [Gammaproteobacteria bacterium AB-CW1]